MPDQLEALLVILAGLLAVALAAWLITRGLTRRDAHADAALVARLRRDASRRERGL